MELKLENQQRVQSLLRLVTGGESSAELGDRTIWSPFRHGNFCVYSHQNFPWI